MNPRMKLFIAVLVIGVVVGGFVIVNLLSNNADQTEIDITLLDNDILDIMEELHIPGVAACAIRNGNIIWSDAYGYADVDGNISTNVDTLFMLGSISKTVTGVAFMQLYEQGLVDLDDDVNDYLPFNLKHPDHPETIITPRMLLSHMSGIRDNWLELGPLETLGDSPIQLSEFCLGYLTPEGDYYSSPNFNSEEPGTYFEYTNAGNTVIGYLVELISGYTFEDYCQSEIFEPLGMNESSWFLGNLNESHIARPYRYYSDAFWPIIHYGQAIYPCGFLRTSVLQLGAFLSMLMENGTLGDVEILNSTTVGLMKTLHYPEIQTGYGFCIQIGENFWGHGGGGPGLSTQMVYVRSQDLGIIVLTNIQNSGAGAIFDAIRTYFSLV